MWATETHARTTPGASGEYSGAYDSLKIKVGPPQLAVHQGYCVMVSEPDGQIPVEGDKGALFS
jgi:hypothetical protein